MNPDTGATSAGTSKPSSSRGGVWGLVLSVLGILTCGLWLFSIPGLIISIVSYRRQARASALIGIVLGGLGIIQFVLMFPLAIGLLLPALSRARAMAGETITENRLEQHGIASKSFQLSNDRYPTSLQELHDAGMITDKARTDGWRNPLKMTVNDHGPPTFSSAGSDEEFGTADDMDHTHSE